jgi:hypothetical protein
MRLIDADTLKRQFLEQFWSVTWPNNMIHGIIDGMPTVDAVPVLRCENCEHFEIDKHYGNHTCWRTGEDTRHDDYCSRGKRKEES